MNQQRVLVRTAEIGVARASFGTGYRSFQRTAQVLGEDSDYADVLVGQVSIKRRLIAVFKRNGQTGWTSDYESAVRYATLREGR